MLKESEIKEIVTARLEDAKALLDARRYEGAIYLCGYAVELGLKARICKTLHWPGFPSTGPEFKDYQSFKTHNLDVLLHLTGIEEQIKATLLAEWSVVSEWDPESRYKPIRKVDSAAAESMLSSTTSLLAKL